MIVKYILLELTESLLDTKILDNTANINNDIYCVNSSKQWAE